MNILLTSQMERNSQTGVRTYYMHLKNEYETKGHNVSVLTPVDSPAFIRLILKVLRKVILFFFRSDFMHLFIVEASYFISIFFAVRKVRRDKLKWDIIHGQELSSSYAAQLALKRKVPAVTTCHYNDNPISECEEMYILSPRQLRMTKRWFEYLYRKNSNYIFVSDYVYKKSKQFLHTSIKKKIIPNGVTFSNIKRRSNSFRPFIVTNVGTIENRKNQILLINAAEYLVKQGFSFQIWLLGRGQKRDEWEKIVQEAGLGGEIRFLGFQNDCLDIISNAHLYVHTALNESWGLAITEAIAMGLPVLALKTGGIAEQFPDSEVGLLPANISPQALAEKIILLSDRHVNITTQQEQYHYAKQFTVQSMANETISFYNTILN